MYTFFVLQDLSVNITNKSVYKEVYNYDRIDTNFFTIKLIFVYYFKIHYLYQH